MKRPARIYFFYSLAASLAGYLIYYLLSNWNAVITLVFDLASNINQIATQVGTAIGLLGAGWGMWSKVQQQDFSRKVKREVGSKALRNGLVLFSVLLDRFTAEDVIKMLQRIDTVPAEMQKTIHDLGTTLIRQEAAPEVPVLDEMTPEEQERFAEEIKILFKLVGHKMDVAISKERVAKVEEARKKITAEFQRPLGLLLAREETKAKQLEMELRQTQERMAGLLEHAQNQKEHPAD